MPPPLETRPCSQISSQLSMYIDITDVKSVLWLKRLQPRNIINYPPVFHQMTSLISVVPDRAVFVVTVYVCVCTCVRVRVYMYSSLRSCLFCVFVDACLCVFKSALHLFKCCLCVFKAIQTPSISFHSGLILSSGINLSFLQVI